MQHPLDHSHCYLNVCAPMVRYSKLAFRTTVKQHGVHVVHTPMILAQVFAQSRSSRQAEYSSTSRENVVVQFAASRSKDLADAAQLVAPFTSGVDINCGCPQRWALAEGIGASLMKQPDLVCDMIAQVKRRTHSVKMSNGHPYPCSIKIRVHDSMSTTVEMVKRAEHMGVDWITVHGRTLKQKNSEPVDVDKIRICKESVQVPVFFNGDITSRDQADEMVKITGVDGVSVARGLLQNPALFAGYETTPWSCVERYIENALELGTSHFIFHHHLMYMLDKSMSRAEKKHFNCLSTIPAILDYLQEFYGYSKIS